MLSKENETQLQKVNTRVDELTAALSHKDKEYQVLCEQCNNKLVEKNQPQKRSKSFEETSREPPNF